MFLIEAVKRFVSYHDPKIDLTWRDFAVELLWFKRCGLVSISWGRFAFHVGVRPSHWKFGHSTGASTENSKLCMDYWGVGPLFLFVRLN